MIFMARSRQRSLKSLCPLFLLLWVAGSGTQAVSAEPRAPQAAGSFYPDDRSELLSLVQELLARQPEPVIAQKPRILIVPHAGYLYSGPIAAGGFRQLQGYSYDGVVVIGFTHQLQFPGSSVETREAYQTPLGLIPIDQEAVAILQRFPGISHVESAHASGEHSMEAELPFLQVALPKLRIVPILMGDATLDDAKHLADALAALSRFGDYLFVFSTDLSHYHTYDQAEAIDERTITAVLSETPQAVDRLFDGGRVEACGRGPILTSLVLASKLGYPTRILLSRANSGDTAGNPSKVVGYAAIGMFDRPQPNTGRLAPASGMALVSAARKTLEESLSARPPQDPNLKSYSDLARAQGIFVTLRKHGELRGCIGRIQTNEPLAKSLPTVTLDAALRDPRFPPVAAQELPDLTIEVSVLTLPSKIKEWKEIMAGRDGVILEERGRSGVFLPQVWDETGWTREEFLQELASQKAGLPPEAWRDATLYTFQDQIFEEDPASAQLRSRAAQ